jgi:hypothetical protein
MQAWDKSTAIANPWHRSTHPSVTDRSATEERAAVQPSLSLLHVVRVSSVLIMSTPDGQIRVGLPVGPLLYSSSLCVGENNIKENGGTILRRKVLA